MILLDRESHGNVVILLLLHINLNSNIDQYFIESLPEITNYNLHTFINGTIEIINQ